jgi:hypothetical protein
MEYSLGIGLDGKASELLGIVRIYWSHRYVWIILGRSVDPWFGIVAELVGGYEVRGLIGCIPFLTIRLFKYTSMPQLLMWVLVWHEVLLVWVWLLSDVMIVILHTAWHLFLECQQGAVDCHNVGSIIVGKVNTSCHSGCVDTEPHWTLVLVNEGWSLRLVDSLVVGVLSFLVLNVGGVEWVWFTSLAGLANSEVSLASVWVVVHWLRVLRTDITVPEGRWCLEMTEMRPIHLFLLP